MTKHVLLLVLLMLQANPAPDAFEGWSALERNRSYAKCGEADKSVVVQVAGPPDAYARDTGVVPWERLLDIVGDSPDSETFCISAIARLSDRLAVWSFVNAAGEVSRSLVADNQLLIPTHRLPEREYLYNLTLRQYKAWPTTRQAARELALLFFDLGGPCGERIIENLPRFRERMRDCNGDMPFPSRWFAQLRTRLPAELLPVVGEHRDTFTASFWVGDTFGSISHVEAAFSLEFGFELTRIEIVAPHLDVAPAF